MQKPAQATTRTSGGKTSPRPRVRTTGFWRGLVVGLALAAAIALAIGLAIPPARFFPPEVAPGATTPPPTLPAPPREALPRAAARPTLPANPPIPAPPSQEPSLATGAIGAAPAPRVHDGGPSGSPSLVPLGD